MKNHRVFISYSRRDARWLDKLKTFLRPLERDAELQLWSDTDIQPSANWHAEIQTAVGDADVAILLISQDFLASDYVASNELPQLLAAASERGLKIFPVIVSSSFLRNSPLLRFQAVNSPSEPLDSLAESEQNRIFTRLTESIDDLLRVASIGVTDAWLERFRGRFIPVQGGECALGDDELYAKQHGLQQHEVRVSSFRLGKYVVTQSEWTAVMNTQPWLGEKNVRYGSDIPAVYVNWYDAGDFVRNINKADTEFVYRLPSTAAALRS